VFVHRLEEAGGAALGAGGITDEEPITVTSSEIWAVDTPATAARVAVNRSWLKLAMTPDTPYACVTTVIVGPVGDDGGGDEPTIMSLAVRGWISNEP
jgi:hypothetical protein